MLRRDVERSRRELKRYFTKPVLTQRFGGVVCEWRDYLRLFEGVRDEIAVGEATPGYPWSKTAARNIHDKDPGAKILIVLRDPRAARSRSICMFGPPPPRGARFANISRRI